MGSTFGLYCPPNQRVLVTGPVERKEYISPFADKVVPGLVLLPKFLQDALLDEFFERIDSFDPGVFERARDWLVKTAADLDHAHLDVGFDFGAVTAQAEQLAARSSRLKDLDLIKRLAVKHQLTLPLGNRESTNESIALRCYEPKTWRKSIEKNYTRKAENKLREVGFIEKGEMLCCSNLAVDWYRGKMRAQEAYLRSRMVTDNQGTQLDLWDVHQKSLSNKSNRRTELMTRMRGFEDYAKETGHVASFFTLTVPSRGHARIANAGSNPSFDNWDVRDGQAWLSKQWSRARSRLAKLNITVYGFRIAEPHHDGTPHWHLVLFCEAHHRGLLWAVLRSRWLSEYADERGAHAHRAEAQCIEDSKGSATGYIAKYIAKNIDGFETGELTSDEDGRTRLEVSALRVTAWASLHGIRQFQQIGGPAVTPYRELRRIRNPVALRTIEPARKACDDHLWGDYIRLNGGVELGRRGRIRLWTDRTGEINAYGEVRGPEIVGVMSVSEALETRTKTWRIIRKCGTALSNGIEAFRSGAGSSSESGSVSWSDSAPDSALGPVSITVPGKNGAGALADPHSWTNPNETSTYGPN